MENDSGTGVPDTKSNNYKPKPWEDIHGNPLSEENLRFVSRFWNDETWEE